MPHLKTGKLRAIAVSSVQRAASLPDVPTVQESGVPDFDVNNWYGLFAPAGTPRAVVERVYREVSEILKTPEMLRRMAADGSEPVGSTPAGFAAHIKAETARWSEVIKKSNIKAD
jgi:tripartite-type tricarboxylate transporter receptor subunit TctC